MKTGVSVAEVIDLQLLYRLDDHGRKQKHIVTQSRKLFERIEKRGGGRSHKLSMESGVAPSTVKNILYGKSINPGIVTLKMLCDGFGITLNEFFSTDVFWELEQEIK